ncbi:hypothetical protein HU200_016404 [Digitaria exilis]|uniref:Transposase (putative) gypsy type domain-containing protein n=1 Tax=Digitaria exilis TaxID=1010633 RepID=A0A835F7V2_9POAL|nr:hypothetical protein HU200_016404 [Digitaria exilis]
MVSARPQPNQTTLNPLRPREQKQSTMAALMEELVEEEILLRFPPGYPASLLRAALVCKSWCGLVSGRAFRRRFRERHRTPPVLGLRVRHPRPLRPHVLLPATTRGPPRRTRPPANTESLLSMANLGWGKAACSHEDIKKWTGADVFRPGELVEWRAPTKDETPSKLTLEDGFVILSLNHIMCGLRMDPSDFLVSVLAHYGIEWFHLTPNSITVLSIFAHLCEAYLGVPPMVEMFAHFHMLDYSNNGETATVGAVNFQLRDNVKRNYPEYYLKASQSVWTCRWFYAKLPLSCRLAFKGNALKELDDWNWKEVLLLSPEQEKQVHQIRQLSIQGLTAVDIVRHYLKHQISPLRQRSHLAGNYIGPADPTRDSDKGACANFTQIKILYLMKFRVSYVSYLDLYEEDIERKLSYLLDLKKTGQKDPPMEPTTPVSQHPDLLYILSTLKHKKQTVEELTGRRSIRKSSADRPLVPASPRSYTRQSAAHMKIVVPPENNSSPVQGHPDIEDEETIEAKKTITMAASPNQGNEHKSIEFPDEIEEGEKIAKVKLISSIIGVKRKFSPGSQRKAKNSSTSFMTKTRMSSLDNGCIKGASLRKEAAAAPNPQSPVLARHSHASSVEKGEKSALFILANVPLHQHVRYCPPKEVDPAQSIAEQVQHQEVLEETASVWVPNAEEINSEVIWDKMVKVGSEYLSSSQKTLSELFEQAEKLFIENKHLKNDRIMLEQQLKDQKKMTDELRKRNELTQISLVKKCIELSLLEEEATVLMKDKEEMQSRVACAKEHLELMRTILCHEKGEGNRES